MDSDIFKLHIESGRIAGKEKTCGKKNKFATEDIAIKMAAAHNRWKSRRHDVEPYPCAFCGQWHIGNIMPIELMQNIITTKEKEE